MSGAIPWKMLQKQYQGDSVYQDDLSKHLVSPEKVKLQQLLCVELKVISVLTVFFSVIKEKNIKKSKIVIISTLLFAASQV